MMSIGNDVAAGKASEEQRNGFGYIAKPIFFVETLIKPWIPAFAGMTGCDFLCFAQ